MDNNEQHTLPTDVNTSLKEEHYELRLTPTPKKSFNFRSPKFIVFAAIILALLLAIAVYVLLFSNNKSSENAHPINETSENEPVAVNKTINISSELGLTVSGSIHTCRLESTDSSMKSNVIKIDPNNFETYEASTSCPDNYSVAPNDETYIWSSQTDNASTHFIGSLSKNPNNFEEGTKLTLPEELSNASVEGWFDNSTEFIMSTSNIIPGQDPEDVFAEYDTTYYRVNVDSSLTTLSYTTVDGHAANSRLIGADSVNNKLIFTRCGGGGCFEIIIVDLADGTEKKYTVEANNTYVDYRTATIYYTKQSDSSNLWAIDYAKNAQRNIPLIGEIGTILPIFNQNKLIFTSDQGTPSSNHVSESKVGMYLLDLITGVYTVILEPNENIWSIWPRVASKDGKLIIIDKKIKNTSEPNESIYSVIRIDTGKESSGSKIGMISDVFMWVE